MGTSSCMNVGIFKASGKPFLNRCIIFLFTINFLHDLLIEFAFMGSIIDCYWGLSFLWAGSVHCSRTRTGS